MDLIGEHGYLENDEAFDTLYARMEVDFPLPIRVDIDRFHNTFILHKLLTTHLPRTAGLDFCEIGCAPGQWLVYFAQYFGYRVCGVDTSAEGVSLTEKNLASAGVEGTVLRGNAFDRPFGDRRFDVIFSHSLIEHFSDPEIVFRLHDRMVKPGGYIYIGMPNLRYLNNLIFVIMARYFGRFRELQHVHNIQTANLDVFREAAEMLDWDILFLDYFGFFIPLLFTPPQFKRQSIKREYNAGWLVGRTLPKSRFFSPSIGLIARKK